MFDAARILASFAALALVLSGAFWMKVAGDRQRHDDPGVLTGHVESASKFLAISVSISAAAALLAIVGRISA